MRSLTDRKVLYKKELIDNNQEIDFLNRPEFDFPTTGKKLNENVLVITDELVGRIDLISYRAYGTVNLWWLICERNFILNPITELTVGRTLYIPSLRDYYDFVNKNTKVTKKPSVKFSNRKLR